MATQLLYLDAEQLLRPGADGAWEPVDAQTLRGEIAVVADQIDSTVTRAAIPRARGPDGARLLERRVAQEFRDSDYRAGLRLGPSDKSGHDEILAIGMGAKALDRALVPAVERGTRVRAVWEPSMLAAQCVKRAGFGGLHLLVLLATPAGLRQILVADGHVLLTRLIPGDTASMRVEVLATEIERTVQFIRNSRVLARQEVLHVWGWGLSQAQDELASRLPAGLEWQATPKVGLLADLEEGGMAALLRACPRCAPPAQLAPVRIRIHFIARRWRQRMAAGTAALLLTFAAMALPMHVQTQDLQRQTAQANAEASAAQQPLDSLQAKVAEAELPLAIVVTGAGLEQTRLRSVQQLQRDARALSQHLGSLAQVRVDAIRWKQNPGESTVAERVGCTDDATVVQLDLALTGSPSQGERELREQHIEQLFDGSRYWKRLPMQSDNDEQISSETMKAQGTPPVIVCLARRTP